MSTKFLTILSLLVCLHWVLEILPVTAVTQRSNSRAILSDHGLERDRNSKEESPSSNGGLVFDVMHRQHPKSPHRQPDKSHATLMQEHVRRGMLRLNSLHRSIAAERTQHQQRSNSGVSNSMPLTREKPYALQEKVLAPAGEWQGEYLVQMELGTPAKVILLIIDTGSGLTWVQCSPCTQCFSQQEPIFDPLASNTYERLDCSNPACGSNSLFQCAESHNRTCEYGVQYGMTSFTTGVVSSETLTVDSLSGSVVQIKKFLFGCGIFNMGAFVGNSGLLGLSRSNISLPMQLAKSGLNYSKRFTHCFADLAEDRNATSFMYLGDSRKHQLQYTPFAMPPFKTQFYYVRLEGISVDGVRLPIPSSVFEFSEDGNGGTVIDSGTTLTLLIQPAYILLRDAFRSAAALRLSDTAFEGLNSTVTSHAIDTCYQFPVQEKPLASQVPPITLHYAHKVDLVLPPNNVLFPFNDEGLYCLAFTGTMSEVGINVIGNIQQQNFKIEYDLENSRIGFGKAYCAEER